MIKLSSILKEIRVEHPSGDRDAYNKIVEYVKNGSKGDLDLSNSNLRKIPPILRKVEGYLNLHGCTSLISLPSNLQVGGVLDLINCTSLISLPDNLKVGRSLYLGNTPIAKRYTRNEIRKMVPGVKGEIYL
jgi:hypothetical protein